MNIQPKKGIYMISMGRVGLKMVCMVFVLCSYISCQRPIPNAVQQSIELAGANGSELKSVLRHYGWRDSDSLKWKAACYLIEHARFHYSKGIGTVMPMLDSLIKQSIDSFRYYGAIHPPGDQRNELLDSWSKRNAARVEQFVKTLSKPEPEPIRCDLEVLSSDFLIRHIDRTFLAWEQSEWKERLSFDQFSEYILPYQSLPYYPYIYDAERMHQTFGRYIDVDSLSNMTDRVQSYNDVLYWLRLAHGKTPFSENSGWYDLFFEGNHDCVDNVFFGALAFRSCGIPMIIEGNIAYKQLARRHYLTLTLDSLGRWLSFSPESTLPSLEIESFKRGLNFYQYYYGACPDNPAVLKCEDESLPDAFASPCLVDVSHRYHTIDTLRLPFDPDTPTRNRLAYLYSCGFGKETLSPITWGTIDSVKKEVLFTHVLHDVLYFPVYMDHDQLRPFGSPFVLHYDSINQQRKLRSLPPTNGATETILLERKYPRKATMQKIAEEMIGGRFVAGNKIDLSDGVELYRIKHAPNDCLQEFNLHNRKAYRYYQYQAPEAFPESRVAMIEFVTLRSYNYPNTHSLTPYALCSPTEVTLFEQTDPKKIRLMDEPLDKCKWKGEYDGNMTTSSGHYPTVTLQLPTPQVVTAIRFAPLNEDNRIKIGQRYRLYCWSKNGFEMIGEEVAKYHFLQFDSVPKGSILLLQNLDEGSEILPFRIINGKQEFFYHTDWLWIFK